MGPTLTVVSLAATLSALAPRTVSAAVPVALPAVAPAAVPAAVAPPVGAPPADFTYPDGPAGALAEEFVDAFNSGDAATFAAFAERRESSTLSPDGRAARVAQCVAIHDMLGALTPTEIRRAEDRRLELVVEATNGGSFLLTLGLDGDEHLSTYTIVPAAAPTRSIDLPAVWSDLADLLETVRERHGLPALAAAVVRGDDLVERAAVGRRRADEETPVTLDDRFHVGSVTKSMTATVVGRLVEQGRLDWDRPLSRCLPDVPMGDAYREVTVADLLRHRAGVPPYTAVGPEEGAELAGLPGSPAEQRRAFAARVLAEEPVGPVGSFAYSNAGYAVLAHAAERAAESSWEDLVREVVFEPLDMSHSGFGWPATEEHGNQPRGHYDLGGGPTVQPLEGYELGACLAPAGDVHCSIADLAAYARSHLRGLRGEDGVVTAATVRRLHDGLPIAGDGDAAYAAGWLVETSDDGAPVHWHNGSAGTFYSRVTLYPRDDLAVVVAINSGAPVNDALSAELSDRVAARLRADG